MSLHGLWSNLYILRCNHFILTSTAGVFFGVSYCQLWGANVTFALKPKWHVFENTKEKAEIEKWKTQTLTPGLEGFLPGFFPFDGFFFLP